VRLGHAWSLRLNYEKADTWWGITEVSWNKLGYLARYMDITLGSRAEFGIPVGYMDIMEGSWAMLESPI
jgi:hypothetical protein